MRVRLFTAFGQGRLGCGLSGAIFSGPLAFAALVKFRIDVILME
jgi:hypothetical protein